jgi:predicted nuclease with TOPRIM domain
MRAKKIVYFFTALLLFSGLLCSVNALSETTVSFSGEGVTIDLSFPEEAHPGENIWHNATLTANSDITLYNLTLIIKAPIDSTWQEATSWILYNRVLAENNNRTEEMNFQLPSNTNGTLQCFIYIDTNQSTHYLSSTLYTTHVSELTFSEMQTLYNEMLANYTALQADYQSKLNEYDELLVNYNSLFDNYTALLSEHNQLMNDYNSQVSTYQSLLTQYNKLSDDYDILNTNYRSKINDYSALQSDYNEVNSTRNSLQASYDTLENVYDALNDTYFKLQDDLSSLQERFNMSEGTVGADRVVMLIFIVTLVALIVFIIYIKRKKTEPYVVIRKETVSVNDEEGS